MISYKLKKMYVLNLTLDILHSRQTKYPGLEESPSNIFRWNIMFFSNKGNYSAQAWKC